MTTSAIDLQQLPAKVPEPVRAVLRQLRQAGYEAWLAGGCVRDLILGRQPEDFDIATSAPPSAVQSVFRRTVPTGIQHGTVTVLLDDATTRSVEVTTFRGEGAYLDGRRPESVEFLSEGRPGDLERDLVRRDFTINAMAFDPECGELRDVNGGLDDLRLKRIRCVGDALQRFSEDGLRTLRAVRFCSTLEFELDDATRSAIPLAMETFRKVAAERVRDELNKMLTRSPKPSRGLNLLRETGLLGEILPELNGQGAVKWNQTTSTVDAAPSDLTVRLAALLGDAASTELLERLRHPRWVIDAVLHLVSLRMLSLAESQSDAAVRRSLQRIGVDSLSSFVALRGAELRAQGRESEVKALTAFRSRMDAQIRRGVPLSIGELAISGNDLVAALGRPPGPWVGQTLRALLDRTLDDPSINTRERLLEIATETERRT